MWWKSNFVPFSINWPLSCQKRFLHLITSDYLRLCQIGSYTEYVDIETGYLGYWSQWFKSQPIDYRKIIFSNVRRKYHLPSCANMGFEVILFHCFSSCLISSAFKSLLIETEKLFAWCFRAPLKLFDDLMLCDLILIFIIACNCKSPSMLKHVPVPQAW